MRRGWFIAGILVVCALIAVVYAGETKGDRLILTHTISQTGDTAAVVKFNQFVARDSFVYIDSIDPGSGSKTRVAWTAPNLVRRILVPADANLDTTITYACSVDCGTNIYGFTWLANNAVTTRAMVIDTLVDSINNVAGMSDTVLAQDSVTYIKLVSKFGQQRLQSAARWTLVLGDSLTESDSIPTLTVATVIDSLVAKINATAAISDSVTAANSGDTVYTITGDRAGWDIICWAGDTAQDTTRTVAAAQSWSYHYDTVPLIQMYQNGWDALWAELSISPATVNRVGYGNADSGWIWIYAVAGTGDRQLIDSTVGAGLPLTLNKAVTSNDTLWREYLEAVIQIADSATDTSYTAKHIFDWYLIGN